MKTLAKYWKIVLALLLAAAALVVILTQYLPGRNAYEDRRTTLQANIDGLQASLAEAAKYPEGIEEDVAAAVRELEASRLELYKHFPSQMKEEDQLLYLLGLEEQFGGGSGELGYSLDLHDIFLEKFNVDISYTFGTTQPLLALSDGAILGGQTITVYFSGAYENVKEMIRYLGEEEVQLTSIQYASMYWQDDTVSGTFTLLNYLLSSELLDYRMPVVDMPDTGKTNIFQ